MTLDNGMLEHALQDRQHPADRRVADALLRAASLLDGHGSAIEAARTTYDLYPSDHLYPPEDLRLGEPLLIDCGLLLEKDGYLYPTGELAELVLLEEDEGAAVVLGRTPSVPPFTTAPSASGAAAAAAADVKGLVEDLIIDAERREELLLALARKHDEAARAELGRRGEEFVVALAQEELVELGRSDLVSGVRRLSKFSDELGYDVVAPRVDGKRRLEVKTSGRPDDEIFRFFISRKEIGWGLRDSDWALVACRIGLDKDLELIGWCRAQALEIYLPSDSQSSRWSECELTVPLTVFDRGLPPVT